MIEKISVIAVAVAAILTAINQISIVITAKQLWRQQQQLQRQLENGIIAGQRLQYRKISYLLPAKL